MIKAKYTIKDFLPLLSVFGLVVVLSLTWTLYLQTDFMRWMEVFMGLFFAVFGAFKVINLKAFAEAYKMYDVIAMRIPTYGLAYPFIELALGALYLFGLYPIFTNTFTLAIMLISALGVYLKLRKREEIMCACLGVVFKVPMTWVTLTEDLLMALMAGAMLINLI